MKIQVNENTLKMLKETLPEDKNVFKTIKYAIDLVNSIQVEVNKTLKDGEILIVKEGKE